jgi:hypothetical protein
VETSANPADDCSRGLTVNKLVNSERWTSGPEFLHKPEDQWPQTDCTKVDISDDPEVKKKYLVNTMLTEESAETMEKLLTHFSSWFRLRRSVAWIIRLKKYLLHKIKRRLITSSQHGVKKKIGVQNGCTGPISTDELQEAERAVVGYVQRKSFPQEWDTLKDLQADQDGTCVSDDQTRQDINVKKTSHIFKLRPYKKNCVLRVGGRLSRAALPEETKFPVILPKQSHITELIMRDAHVATGHSGRNHMLAYVRKKYWVINANTAARRIISKCVTCRRQKGKVGEQLMADLPEDRVTPDEPPFSCVGMDYFGPLEVKKGRSLLKRYGVIFTCLATRAIHLEKADSLDTDSCVNAIRRFIARRGQVREIRSDNGTNLVGAERELKAEIRRWNQTKIHNCLLQKNIEWKFNPPTGSHFGGIWERQIRTVRKIMTSIVREQTLTDESLCTLFCEVEAIINSRPITTAQSEAGDLEPLTPNHLLLLKAKPSLPPIIAEETGPYARRRWKQVQYLANLFWKRWTREYLLQLQERQKWVRPRANIKTGDIVLIVDGSRPRNTWTMGRVIKTRPDKMGLVRQVELQTKSSVLVRPIHKLCLLLEADIPEEVLQATEKTNKASLKNPSVKLSKKTENTKCKPALDNSASRMRLRRLSRPPKRLDL